jgi:hypothetical protein
MYGGEILDDVSTGNEDYAITTTALQGVFGTAISSAGRTFSIFDTVSGAAFMVWLNASPTVLHPCPSFSTSSICSEVNTGAGFAPYFNTPILGLGNESGVLYLRGAGTGTPPNCPTSPQYPNTLGCVDVPITTDSLVGRSTTDTLSNKSLTSPTINGLTNGTGIQRFNSTTTCTTAATAGATCTTASINLPVGYSDTNYTVSVTPLGPTNVPVFQTVTKSNTSFTITIVAITAGAASFSSYDVTVTHN